MNCLRPISLCDRRGFVLVAVLALSTLAAAIAMEAAFLVRMEGERVGIERDKIQAELFSRAGELLAIDVLLADPRGIDTREDLWNSPIILGRPEGRISAVITDEASKFPINQVVTDDGLLNIAFKDALERLCAALELPVTAADDIVDFLDADDLPFRQGAESNYYSLMDPPRRAVNRRLHGTDELAGVRGLGGPEGMTLMDLSSAHGGGLVNINTASAEVIRAVLPGVSDLTAERIASRAEVFPFRSVGEMAALAGLPESGTDLEKSVSVSSDVFRIESSGVSGSVGVSTTSIVRRTDKGVEVLYRRVD